MNDNYDGNGNDAFKKGNGNVIDENKHLKKLLNSESKARLVDGTDKLMRPKRERRLLVNSGDHGDRVAFYAFMSNNEAILKHHTLTFDVTKVNYGSGYNNNTGIFTAPASGVYVITTTIHPFINSAASIDIIVNNNVQGSIFTDSTEGYETNAATGIVIAWMNQGDVSFVRTSANYNSYGSLYSIIINRCSFTGWKISD
ncbi:unnamed protein product [Mytilus edulis]|uniref:C1q domain-containing protein n=1 Tax=Mytilus edulis TaxID=6550 RepID=A0A8S3SXJ0_MYTED|nr:unnamed protein product [Mytilus edulis]